MLKAPSATRATRRVRRSTKRSPGVPEHRPLPWLDHDIPLTIVAHSRRRREAERLSTIVGAQAISWDNHHQGCEANHRKAWSWLAQGRPEQYSVVLEDDVVVAQDFRHQLNKVLAVAPSPLVSLYLGQGRPPHWQPAIAYAITSLTRDVCWFLGPELLSAQGYAIRTSLLPSLLNATKDTDTPIDEQISKWAKRKKITVAYTWPSIVNHREDLPPLIEQRADGQPRIEKRVAWRFGGRPKWSISAAEMKSPTQLGMKVVRR